MISDSTKTMFNKHTFYMILPMKGRHPFENQIQFHSFDGIPLLLIKNVASHFASRKTEKDILRKETSELWIPVETN